VKNFERKQIIPALFRPAMYTGEQGDRTTTEWHADAVAEYLNGMAILEDRYSNQVTTTTAEREPMPISTNPQGVE
jgi:hypothetical protein